MYTNVVLSLFEPHSFKALGYHEQQPSTIVPPVMVKGGIEED